MRTEGTVSVETPPSSGPSSDRDATPPITTQPISSSLIRGARPAPERRRISLVVYHRDGAEVAILAPGIPLVVGRCSPSALRIPAYELTRSISVSDLVTGRNTPTRPTSWLRVSSTPRAIVDLPVWPSADVM